MGTQAHWLLAMFKFTKLKLLFGLIKVMTLDIYKAIVKASEQGNLWGL